MCLCVCVCVNYGTGNFTFAFVLMNCVLTLCSLGTKILEYVLKSLPLVFLVNCKQAKCKFTLIYDVTEYFDLVLFVVDCFVQNCKSELFDSRLGDWCLTWI